MRTDFANNARDMDRRTELREYRGRHVRLCYADGQWVTGSIVTVGLHTTLVRVTGHKEGMTMVGVGHEGYVGLGGLTSCEEWPVDVTGEEPTPMIPQDPEIDWDEPDVHPTTPEQPEPTKIEQPKEGEAA